MSAKLTLTLIAAMVFLPSFALATVYIDDGLETVLNGSNPVYDNIIVDSVNTDPYSTLTMLSGAYISGYLDILSRGHLYMEGGTVIQDIYLYDNAYAAISGGTVNVKLRAQDNSIIVISGGDIFGYLWGTENGVFKISGGIFYDDLKGFDNSNTIIAGTDFYIDGQPAAYGDYQFAAYTWHTITGTLYNGDPINTDLYSGTYTTVFTLTPELSCTLDLQGDLNNDCRIDLIDFTMMAANWLLDCNMDPTNSRCR